MVLVGGGVVCPLLWPLRAAAPGKAEPASAPAELSSVAGFSSTAEPPSAAQHPVATHQEVDPAQAGDVPNDPKGCDIAPFSSSAVTEAGASPEPTLPAGMLIAYTWTGNNDTDWDDSGNWSSAGGGYPDDCGDDATVSSGTWDITLVALQIDDLEISGNVDFDGSAQSPPVLKADSITLSGSGAITLTFTSTCTLKTFGCP